jgi:hypothetical protein
MLLSIQLKNIAVEFSVETDTDKKLKLRILENENQLEAVNYINDNTLAMQTNW